jgi:AcrR family transcriptional regulator
MEITEKTPSTIDDDLAASPGPRERILRAAAMLLAEGGREAVSTRAVSAAAGVQPPTIYRQFGDMQGLLDAVAEDGFSRYMREKISRESTEDPVADLRTGWDAHVAFGLANPAVYVLMFGDPRPGIVPTAAAESQKLLEQLLRRVAEAGRLRTGEHRAARMIHASCVGVVLTLNAAQGAVRDLALSDLMREAVLAAITTDATPLGMPGPRPGAARAAAHAIALKALLPEVPAGFTAAERNLLAEWLDRLVQER